jgi:hypothetical protein
MISVQHIRLPLAVPNILFLLLNSEILRGMLFSNGISPLYIH